ncbi:MAG: SGNH/GDSL hydrolase family protein [Frankia sp.]|nr:SGNH/GDSL hydrolase family protein [Frankia sp.]
MRTFLRVALATTCLAATACRSAPAVPPVPFPASMAALGDSITAAAVPSRSQTDSAYPRLSWATGDSPDDGTRSQFERIRARLPAIAGHVFNDAVSGSLMRDAPAQAARAVAQRVGYVTLLMGANDVCQPSVAQMTPVGEFTTSVSTALATVSRGLPNARIYVVSIPDISRLWRLFRDNRVATAVWAQAGACPPLIGAATSDADRSAARQRIVDFNHALRDTCDATPLCRYDDDAVFRHKTARDEVSDADYFHPSVRGQRTLADVTWRHGYWPKS